MAEDLGTKVQYASVQEMANRIRVVSQGIVNDLAEMDAAVKVVTGTWDGEAFAQYTALQKKYRELADDMKNRLELVAKAIEAGKENYRSTDVKASQLFTEAY
ncbi:WXG100 family type VII secretion target [Streptomyces sp. NPDC049837]|uniref:WXG100 family type VII secretion target n=1 Tax=Streptomyces sp. NPDC049837 TaxID=3155277 RepID=UPI003439953C